MWKTIFFRSLLFSGAFHDILPEFPRWEIWPRRSHFLFSIQSLEKLPEGHVWREGMPTYVHDTQKCFVSRISSSSSSSSSPLLSLVEVPAKLAIIRNYYYLFFHLLSWIHIYSHAQIWTCAYFLLFRHQLVFAFHWYFVFHKCGGYYVIKRFSSELTSSW